jgi:hypothetical protein
MTARGSSARAVTLTSVAFRSKIELVNDDAGIELSRRRRGREPRVRDDHLIIGLAAGPALRARDQARRQEAITMANDDDSLTRLVLADREAALSRARARPGPHRPRAKAACGPVDDLGLCRNSHHEAGCARAMVSATSMATFVPPGGAEYEAAQQHAAAERARMRDMVRSPAARAAEAERQRNADEARAEKQRRAALRETGSNWATTGRGARWLR